MTLGQSMSRSTFEQELKEKGILVYTNVGSSMCPLIRQGKDVMIIRRPQNWDAYEGNTVSKVRKLDVPLYRRDRGQYVLHRVVKVTEEGYVLRGDNTYSDEKGITDQNILGVLTGVRRNGKEMSVDSTKYKLYTYFWYYIYPVRKIVVWIKRKMQR